MDELSQIAAIVRGDQLHPARIHDNTVARYACLQSLGGALTSGTGLVFLSYGRDNNIALLQALGTVILVLGIGLVAYGTRTSWVITARRRRFRTTAFTLGGVAGGLSCFVYLSCTLGSAPMVFTFMILPIAYCFATLACIISGAIAYPFGLGLDHLTRPPGEIQQLGCGSEHERTN